MTANELRRKVVSKALSYLGCKESNGSHKQIIDLYNSHKQIIDLYNSHKPLARGYAVKYTDEWCATFVSAVSIACGLTDIMPTECSCSKMIELYKKMGRWKEADDYVPQMGDIIMYDWQDSGKGDNTGAPDHVGIVTAVNGIEITVVEGNKHESVAYRDMSVNGRYIRGYCLPNYGEEAKKPDLIPTIEPAREFSTSVAKKYTVTASALNMRRGAGMSKKIIKTLPRDAKVTCYGYYTQQSGTIWLLVKDSAGDVGFCSKKYLK